MQGNGGSWWINKLRCVQKTTEDCRKAQTVSPVYQPKDTKSIKPHLLNLLPIQRWGRTWQKRLGDVHVVSVFSSAARINSFPACGKSSIQHDPELQVHLSSNSFPAKQPPILPRHSMHGICAYIDPCSKDGIHGAFGNCITGFLSIDPMPK